VVCCGGVRPLSFRFEAEWVCLCHRLAASTGMEGNIAVNAGLDHAGRALFIFHIGPRVSGRSQSRVNMLPVELIALIQQSQFVGWASYDRVDCPGPRFLQRFRRSIQCPVLPTR
jgi:hypothetical protein